jgi:serine/threonine protein kinase
MAETMPSIPGYEILSELRRGGMGIVYKAQDLKNDRLVAVKMILSGLGADFVELARFRIEAEAIGSLEHPNIVESRGIGVHLGYPFFVLEYAEGGSLAKRIRSQRVPCDWTAYTCLKLALAMEHAHKRGVIHRDLKPSNVLMMSDDIPKITDFGFAKFTTGYDRNVMTISIPDDFTYLTEAAEEDERIMHTARDDTTITYEEYLVRKEWKKRIGTPSAEDEQRLDSIMHFLQEAIRQGLVDLPEELEARTKLTRSGTIMGTPQYMAPEQALGQVKAVGPSADIYSLGAIMYEMLTGQPPFTGQMFSIITEIVSRPPVAPRQRRDSVPPGLDAICMKCLEKTAERRYESMGKLTEDLQRFINGAEVSALNETPSLNPDVHFDDEAQETLETDLFPRSATSPAGETKIKSWWQFWR